MARNTRPGKTHNATVGHAVVLGASMAGLAAAAALAASCERVSIVERDPLPAAGEVAADAQRRGVPQGRHVHFLMAGGVAALETLLPGITHDFRAAGARLLDGRGNHCVLAGGGPVRLDALDPSWVLVAATRPLIERVVRERVRALDNVAVQDGLRALGLMPSDRGRAVRGVRLAAAAPGDADQRLEADLVVDATGRASRTPLWLQELGYEPPTVQRLPIDARYTTRFFQRGDEVPDDRHGIMIATLPGTNRQGGALVVEGDRWMVSLMALDGDQAPTDLDGFRAYARSLWASDIYDLVAAAEPLGDAVTGGFPANVRHRYDRLRRFPGRLAVLGDALCATNPHFARGMNVAACEAVALRRALDRHGPVEIGPRLFRATRPLTDASWTFVTDNDLLDPDVEGARTLRWRLVTAYSTRVTRAAHHDPVVARAFMDVFGVRRPPTSTLRPDLVVRTLLASRRPRPTAAAARAVRVEPGEPAS